MTSNKNIFKISYPILLTLISQNIINVTNTAFLGRLGEVELGASAIGGVFYFAIFMIGFGFSQGAQILIGRRNGEHNYKQIGAIFNNALLFNLLLSIFIFAISLKGVPILMKYMVSSDSVYKSTIAYLDWRIYGYFFAFINAIFRAFYVGVTQTRILTTSAILMAITNIALDYTLIFGKFGFAPLGIEGAGISSVIAEIITLIYVILYTVFKVDLKQYALFQIRKVEIKTVLQILELSIFIMFQYFISISTWFMFFIFIEHMGERQLAVSNIGRSLYILLMIPASALATTVNTLVSNLIGAGRKEDVIPLINKVAFISFVIVLPFMIFTFVFPEILAQIYTDDASLIQASISVIKIISVANLFFALFFIIFNGVSGTGNTRTAFLIEVVTLFFYISYVYYTTIVNPSTVAVVWMSEFVYWILIGGLGYGYLLKGNWRKKEL
ncbi:MAG: MATE family efflux transporter [Porphyromonadaceae bacterium CG2_30_38_12]|nr:MAG: MATE family efflux transporter [Porphyromonadaceae bacterium CG2_30_38_12]